MEIYVVFGLPGAGKTYVGQILQKYFGFHFYDGDQDMPKDLKEAIIKQTVIGDFLRDKFFNKLIESAKRLTTEHPKLVIAQTFIKEKYRDQFLKSLPQTKFILVQADPQIREKRLVNRNELELDLNYWKKMAEIFEPPVVTHKQIQNNNEGEEELRKQLQTVFT